LYPGMHKLKLWDQETVDYLSKTNSLVVLVPQGTGTVGENAAGMQNILFITVDYLTFFSGDLGALRAP